MKRFAYILFAAILLAAYFGFQIQESQKFYYGFNEKIPLTDVDTKLVIRYPDEMSKESASSFLARTYANANQQWQDQRTVIVSTNSIARRDSIIKDLRKSNNVVSCHPMYKVNSGLEMALTDEFVVKFKDGIDIDKQDDAIRNRILTALEKGAFRWRTIDKLVSIS